MAASGGRSHPARDDEIGGERSAHTDARLLSRRGVLAGLVGAAGLTALPAMAGRVLLPAATAAGAVTVLVDPENDIGALPPRSMGFSFEKSTLATPLFSASNTALVALFRLLGPGVLRIGGNSVDKVTFDPAGAGATPGVVAPADLARLAAFADAADWQVLYGTPFLFATADQVRDEAVAAAGALGTRLDAFELCNEPDLYVLNAVAKPIAGTAALFNARWQAFADAVRGALPAARLSGPATCFMTLVHSYTVPFAATHGADISLLTQHYYRGFGFGPQTIDLLLGADPALDAGLAELRTTAIARGLTYRLAETNSFASGGQPGVSNTFASALWGAGLYAKAGAAGAAGVNIHNSGSGPGYPAIVTAGGVVTQIRPLYYGLLLAAAAGNGPMPAVSLVGADPTLRVHAVRRSPTDLRVMLLNTGIDSVDVTVDAGQPVDAAGVTRLEGPALDATSGVSFAGAVVGIDGSFAPAAPGAVAAAGAQVTVTVPAGSGALLALTLQALPETTTTSSTTTSTSTSSSTTTSSTTSTTPSTTTSTTTPSATTTTSPAGPGGGAGAAPAATPARPVTGTPSFTG